MREGHRLVRSHVHSSSRTSSAAPLPRAWDWTGLCRSACVAVCVGKGEKTSMNDCDDVEAPKKALPCLALDTPHYALTTSIPTQTTQKR